MWTRETAWKIGDAPTLRIGVVEGDSAYVFGEVVGAARLSDGRVVVADAHNHQLRYFEPGGKLLRTMGRQGSGPGEFQGISWINECGGDSVFVYDFVLQRISVFDPDGDLARSFHPRTPVRGRGPARLACAPGGRFVVSTRSTDAVRRRVGPHRLTAPVAVISQYGSVVHDFGEFPGPDRYRHRNSDGPHPLGRDIALAVSADRVFIGTADAYEIGIFSLDGAQEGLIRLDSPPRRVSRRDRDLYVQTQLAEIEDPNSRRRSAAWYRSLDFPEFLPAYMSFLTDPEGNLWVEEYLRPGERNPRWSVFSSTGHFMGTIEMPERFTAFQFGRDFVLGRWTDPLGTPFVRGYPIAKPARTAPPGGS
jgi:hypothetical protein